MKNIKKISSILISVLLIVFSTVMSAAELNINSASAQIGDTVTYTLNLADVPSPVSGVQLSIYYDIEFLEVDPASVTCEGFPTALYNTDIPGEIIMNAANAIDGFDFKTKNEMISVTFNVIKDGTTNITYFIEELYDIYEDGPGDYLKTYTLTSDISVNGDTTVTDIPPVLNPEKQEIGNSGDFVNNESGIGEVSPEDATVPPTDENGNVETDNSDEPGVDGSTASDENGEDGEIGENAENIDSADTGSDSSNSDNSPLIIALIAVIVVAVVAVISLIVVLSRKNKKNDTNK